MRKVGLIAAITLVVGTFSIGAIADDLGNGGKNPGDTVNGGGGKCLKNCSVKMNTSTAANSTTAAKVKPGVKSDEIIGPKIPVPPTGK